MLRVLPFLLVAACAVPDADPSSAAAGRVGPPPFLPVLSADPIFPGEDFTATVTGVPAGADIYLLYSTTGPGAGPCHPREPICADILGPVRLLDRAIASSTGGTFIATAPTTIPTPVVWLQAAVVSPAGAAVSNVVLRVVNDTDGDLILDDRDNCVDVPNPYQVDDDADGVGAACDCDDLDPSTAPSFVDATFDGTDQDCDGVDGPADFWDGTYDLVTELEIDVPLLGTQVCVAQGLVTIDHAASPAVTSTPLSCSISLFGTVSGELIADLDLTAPRFEGVFGTSVFGDVPFAADLFLGVGDVRAFSGSLSFDAGFGGTGTILVAGQSL